MTGFPMFMVVCCSLQIYIRNYLACQYLCGRLYINIILCLHCGLLLFRNKLATDSSLPNINLVTSREISRTHQKESAHVKGLGHIFFNLELIAINNYLRVNTIVVLSIKLWTTYPNSPLNNNDCISFPCKKVQTPKLWIFLQLEYFS